MAADLARVQEHLRGLWCGRLGCISGGRDARTTNVKEVGLPSRASKVLVLAIDSLIDFESWARMRSEHGLSVTEACALWVRAIDGLLPPTPAVS